MSKWSCNNRIQRSFFIDVSLYFFLRTSAEISLRCKAASNEASVDARVEAGRPSTEMGGGAAVHGFPGNLGNIQECSSSHFVAWVSDHCKEERNMFLVDMSCPIVHLPLALISSCKILWRMLCHENGRCSEMQNPGPPLLGWDACARAWPWGTACCNKTWIDGSEMG